MGVGMRTGRPVAKIEIVGGPRRHPGVLHAAAQDGTGVGGSDALAIHADLLNEPLTHDTSSYAQISK